MYASLQSQKRDFSIEVLNLISLPLDLASPKFRLLIWSIVYQFFFYIPLLYYYINLSPGFSISNHVFFASLSTVSEFFCDELLETFVALSAIL